jgi:Domain of unknown function (DUF4157)
VNRSRRVTPPQARSLTTSLVALRHTLPRHVQAAIDSPGAALDPPTAVAMEARLGHHFGHVRIHSGAAATRSAAMLGARAYALGDDVVLPHRGSAASSLDRRRLLAHELAHVAQQRVGATAADPEPAACAAADAAMRGHTIGARTLGGAAPGLHRDPVPDERREPLTLAPLRLDWDEVTRPRRAATRPGFDLPPLQVDPSLAAAISPPSAVTPPRDVPRNLVPPPAPAAQAAAPSAAPSRLSLVDTGRFSLGLRLGFPEAEPVAGAPPSAALEGMKRAQLLQQQLTGRLPSSWELVDKSQLAGIVWSLLSTRVAPDLARAISRSLSRPAPPGVSVQLDLLVLTEFDGGGISLTVTLP